MRFIKASARRRDEQENHYRTLYGRARARELTHRAESAEDPQLALLYAIEVIELSPDPLPAGWSVPACTAWELPISSRFPAAAPWRRPAGSGSA